MASTSAVGAKLTAGLPGTGLQGCDWLSTHATAANEDGRHRGTTSEPDSIPSQVPARRSQGASMGNDLPPRYSYSALPAAAVRMERLLDGAAAAIACNADGTAATASANRHLLAGSSAATEGSQVALWGWLAMVASWACPAGTTNATTTTTTTGADGAVG